MSVELKSNLLQEFNEMKEKLSKGKLSDGYHTHNELYDFRLVYNACLFNEWAKLGINNVHKSYRHNDGELCFEGGWFIVVAVIDGRQVSNHYENQYWNLFKIPEEPKALFEYDGHTPKDVLHTLTNYALSK